MSGIYYSYSLSQTYINEVLNFNRVSSMCSKKSLLSVQPLFSKKNKSDHKSSISINLFVLFTFLCYLENKWALNGHCFKLCCSSKCTFTRCSSCSRLSVKTVIHSIQLNIGTDYTMHVNNWKNTRAKNISFI